MTMELSSTLRMYQFFASSASFLDQASSAMVNLYQVFTYIVQCRLCGTIRCAWEVMNKAVDGVS